MAVKYHFDGGCRKKQVLECKAAAGPFNNSRRCVYAFALSSAMVLLLVSPLIIYVSQIDLYTLKLTGRYRKVRSEKDWAAIEAEKAALPKDPYFQNLNAKQLQQQIPCRVISLKRAVERRQEVAKQLTQAGVRNFELVDGVDERNDDINDQTITKYVRGVRFKLFKQRQRYQLGKVAADLSHYSQLERIVAEIKPAIVMEDDVELHTKDFYSDLLLAVRELPQDWQILYLLACPGHLLLFGKPMGSHIAVMRGGVCIPAYLVNPSGAKTILAAARESASKDLGPVTDYLYHWLMRHGDLQAYIADPSLVEFGHSHGNSLIPYSKMYEGMWFWEKPWI